MEQEILAGYGEHLRMRGLADSTVRSHLRWVSRFLDFRHASGMDGNGIEMSEVDGFLGLWLPSLSRRSRSIPVAVMRGFLKFLYGEGIVDRNLADLVIGVRIYYHQVRMFCEYLSRTTPDVFVPGKRFDPVFKPPRIPIVLAEDEVAALIKATDALDENKRWPLRRLTFRVVITLLYCCGLRVGEIVRLNVGDVDTGEGVLRVRNTKFFKTRLVPMSPPVTELLAGYLAERRKNGMPGTPESPLFYSSRKRRYLRERYNRS